MTDATGETVQILVAQLGARRHYAVPLAFDSADMLYELHTDWCANGGLVRWICDAIPRRLQPARLRRLAQRIVPQVERAKIKTYPQLTLTRGLNSLRRCGVSRQYHGYVRSNIAFGREVCRRGFGRAQAVYGFNAAAFEIFRAAKAHGLLTILDQTMAPLAYVEGLLAEERQRWPGWDEAPPDEADWRPFADREQAEWELADIIVCGSAFVVDTMRELQRPTERCHVVPHGLGKLGMGRPDSVGSARPLRVLFAGTVELRKGVPYLLEAARLIGSGCAEFRVVGPLRVSQQATRELATVLDLRGPVPRSEVAAHYAWADVFVLPTLAEGSANVCYEALAHGLPVITTPHAGSVIRDGEDGFLVPIRSGAAIAERIMELTARPDKLAQMSEQARARAEQYSMTRYEASLVAAARKGLKLKSPNGGLQANSTSSPPCPELRDKGRNGLQPNRP